ncbi:hypothetical protein BOV97_13130, partial [Solemya velum gill symbiont]|uniref:reverse transcriptase domain-containing protein n=1 Tax=Solemya velum gill symbiont TaxID=2340 RepID=UPI0009D4917E
PWLDTHIKRKIRARKRAYRKAKRKNTHFYWEKFRKLRNETVAAIRKNKISYYNNLSNKLQNTHLSPADWWKTLKSFISTKEQQPIPPLHINGEIITDNIEKANILNNFFVQQTYINETNVNIPTLNQYSGTFVLNYVQFTPLEVHSVLSTLPLGKASGPDGISNRILREAANELSVPLCDLFNKSLDKCIVPKIWKQAHVTAVFKKGDPSLVQNYRPISLLNTIEKAFERLIFKYLYNHLMKINFLTPMQSGFTPGDCTTNQLLSIYNSFCRALDEGKEIRVIFFDISKAFDKVWHRGLIAKLKAAGISGKFLEWCTNPVHSLIVKQFTAVFPRVPY